MKSFIGSFIGLVLSVSVGAESLLEGRVRLTSGAPAVGARVLLFDLTDLRAAPLAATTDESGHFTLSLGALQEGSAALPQQFALGANYPNPFNPSTIVPYQLSTTMHVRLEVFNILGQYIATLVDGERAGGSHTARWDATDAAGQAMAAGVYFYRLSGDGVHVTRRMVLIDGQAGVPSAGGGGLEAVVASAEPAPVYGLVVSGRGFVPYVDPGFRVALGGGLVDLVVETLDSVPRAKALAAGSHCSCDDRWQGVFRVAVSRSDGAGTAGAVRVGAELPQPVQSLDDYSLRQINAKGGPSLKASNNSTASNFLQCPCRRISFPAALAPTVPL